MYQILGWVLFVVSLVSETFSFRSVVGTLNLSDQEWSEEVY